jgi:hypothetical protein
MGNTHGLIRLRNAALMLLALGAAATGHMFVQEIGEALAGAWTKATVDEGAGRLQG